MVRLYSFFKLILLMVFWGISCAVNASDIATRTLEKSTSEAEIKLAVVENFSGSFANTGEAVYRNMVWAVERINARGGVKLPSGARLLRLKRYDSKGKNEEALSALRSAIEDGAYAILQGNSSATAATLIAAINKHNQRDPARAVLFLNYSAIDPTLTNENCSFWHFRFDAHVNMRMAALLQVVQQNQELKKIYLIGQDYSFGHAVAKEAKKQLAIQRPDIKIVGETLHALGRVKDFSPYIHAIISSGAQAVITGNWGSDLSLLIKSARDAGFDGIFYTFYGNALGTPAAIGNAGVGKVIAVAEWFPNAPTEQSKAFYQSFLTRFPKPADDYVHMRMQLMVEAWAQAVEQAGTINTIAVAKALEHIQVSLFGQEGKMRATDHQFQQPLMVGLMDKKGTPGVAFDVEGSGYGFRVIKNITAEQAEQPTSCVMWRP